uniref:hypothetical protein n=1 Tax=Falsiroseomonas oryzae TaxID=2766473 RepID=UPI0022EB606E
MTIRDLSVAASVAAALGLAGAALAQPSTPQQPTGQQVNPSPMPPGSRAGDAPGMGSTGAAAAQGAPTRDANPSPMPPG